MITRIKSDKIILRDRLFSGYVYFENDKILSVTDKNLEFDIEYDAKDRYVSPGFIDIHTHGGAGNDFIDGVQQVVDGCNFHLIHGTTSICPTISAAPFDKMSLAVEYIKQAVSHPGLKTNIIGAHLEGPYFSPAQCGAQNTDFITPPRKEDYVSLIEKLGKYIARWSYAPEYDQDGEFCKYLVSNGIIASAGHTNAIYDDMKTAMDNGCSLVTHLFSCTSTITRDHGFRRLGVIESAFLHDDMFVEIIADGKHLPSELIKLILKIKGTDKTALVTDSLSITGTDSFCGDMNGTKYVIEDGVCKLLDRSAFAGSIATADRLIRVVKNDVGIDIVDAVKMMTAVPAQIMNVNKGELAEGFDADILIFDDNINITDIWVMGDHLTTN